MFNAIRKALGAKRQPDPSGDDAKLKHVARALQADQVRVIVALNHDGLDPASATPQMILEQTRAAAERLNSAEQFAPFVYEEDGLRKLPFFSDLEMASSFFEEFSRRRNRLYALEVLGIRTAGLAQICAAGDRVVLNPWSPQAVEITPAELIAMLNTLHGS